MSGSRFSHPPVLALVGPTAVGKTALALGIAARRESEIVSLDSRQMYRRMDVGTAKPSAAELAAAAHHLIDIAAPDRSLTLAEVQALAFEAIEQILGRGRLPIVTGGTGQYFRAVVEGWEIPAVAPDPALRAELYAEAERDGGASLHARLAVVDPAAARRIDARNLRRVVRALEVYQKTGEPISAIQDRSAPPYDFRIAGLRRSREALYARVDARIDAMIGAGLEAEVRALVAAGFGFDLPAMSAIGYREWRDYLAGEIDRDEVILRIRRNTRRLVRGQGGWFRADDPRLRWFELGAGAEGSVVADILRWLSEEG